MTTETTIEDAVIFIEQPQGGWRWLLEKNLAGVTPIKRLVFSMGRAGIQRILIVSRDLDQPGRERLESGLNQDPRSRSEIRVLDVKDPKTLPDALGDDEDKTFLVAQGNLVTTSASMKHFLREEEPCNGLRLVKAPSMQDCRKQFASAEPVFNSVTGNSKSLAGFLEMVESASSFRRVEGQLLDHYRRHYTQLMDVYFNSHFSIPISSLLVRLPLTPNQVTLMGLGIGALAGWFFSRGDYWSGVLGGILLAFTAIWDCCDGDVARLKFMESDFGEALDTACDNIINVFLFGGIAWGVAGNFGLGYALTPFLLLAVGGFSIFALIYFPGGGKGDFFKGTQVYDVILLLASRNFIYVILIFALAGRLEWFLWLAGYGSLVFALFLFVAWRRIRCQVEA